MSKSIRETGIPIGNTVPNIKLENWNHTLQEMYPFKQRTALFFVSLGCSHCIDLLPFLCDIQKAHQVDILLFSTGTNEDHAEMVDYFHWNFPVISFDPRKMMDDFNVSLLPFTMVVDQSGTVINKGAVFNDDDFTFFNKNLLNEGA